MDLAAIEEELDSQAQTKPPRKRAGCQPLPLALQRIEHRHEPESCQCGAYLVQIDKDVSEILQEDASFGKILQRLQPLLARIRCPRSTICFTAIRCPHHLRCLNPLALTAKKLNLAFVCTPNYSLHGLAGRFARLALSVGGGVVGEGTAQD